MLANQSVLNCLSLTVGMGMALMDRQISSPGFRGVRCVPSKDAQAVRARVWSETRIRTTLESGMTAGRNDNVCGQTGVIKMP